jgi:hypothetical protein
MAFQTAAGHTSLPNGNFSPVIYSKQVQLAFRKSSVVEGITNSDYFGEISQMGDTVKIIKEPEITVKQYARGTQITPQDLDDEDFSLVVDKANYFAFKVDDIEEAHSHVNFQSLASDRAAYRLSDQYDQEVLGYLSGFKQSSLNTVAGTANDVVNGTKAVSTAGSDELLSSMLVDAADFNGGSANNSIVVQPRGMGDGVNTTAAHATPLAVINRMSRKLDQQFVDKEGRWLVIDPVFAELLKDEDSRIMNGDFVSSKDELKNGMIFGNLHGFKVYMSNNLPAKGNGPTGATATGSSHYGVIVAGHSSAVATAEQINKTETYRDPDSFADIVRGMHLYGRKILRPEALTRAFYVSKF